MWGQAALLSALIGVCAGYWSGQSYKQIAKGAGITVVSSATASSISGALTGHFIAPFIGGAAGFATGLLLRKYFLSKNDDLLAEEIRAPIDYFAPSHYFSDPHYFNNDTYFSNNSLVLPMSLLPDEPIGMIKDGRLLFNEQAIKKQFMT